MVRRAQPPEVGYEILDTLERAFEQATNVGIEAGGASGLRQRLRSLLRRLLQAHFGELPETAVARL